MKIVFVVYKASSFDPTFAFTLEKCILQSAMVGIKQNMSCTFKFWFQNMNQWHMYYFGISITDSIRNSLTWLTLD